MQLNMQLSMQLKI